MFRAESEVRERLKRVFDSCVEVALADGVITEDEQAILDSVKEGVAGVERQLMEMLNEDHDDDEFADLVAQCFEYLVENARLVALADGVITEDEQALLIQLIAHAAEVAGAEANA